MELRFAVEYEHVQCVMPITRQLDDQANYIWRLLQLIGRWNICSDVSSNTWTGTSDTLWVLYNNDAVDFTAD